MRDTVVLFSVVPLVTALIGYVTNWAAVKMIFHPAEPRGVGPFRWQGIAYRMAPKFAGEIAVTTGKVVGPSDIAERLQLDAFVARLVDEAPGELDRVVGDAVEVVAPGAWAAMDVEARVQLRSMLLAQLDPVLRERAGSLAAQAEDLVDLDRITVEQLTGDNAHRLARVAKEVGERELRFIELAGGVFGFIIGLAQAVAFDVFGRWWTMPIVGGLVGLGTNWIAIQMIFRPLEPRRFFGVVTYQGMFPKRQAKIAADYGRIAAFEILTPGNLIDHVASAPLAAGMVDGLSLSMRGALEEARPALALLAGREVGDDDLDEIGTAIMRSVGEAAPKIRPILEAHLESSLRLDQLIESRLACLDKLEFERMLRGIFEEDEIILVLIGGALGAAIGAGQGGFVLTLGL